MCIHISHSLFSQAIKYCEYISELSYTNLKKALIRWVNFRIVLSFGSLCLFRNFFTYAYSSCTRYSLQNNAPKNNKNFRIPLVVSTTDSSKLTSVMIFLGDCTEDPAFGYILPGGVHFAASVIDCTIPHFVVVVGSAAALGNHFHAYEYECWLLSCEYTYSCRKIAQALQNGNLL